jgi:hypothetical protein
LLQDGADRLDVAELRPRTVSTVTKRGNAKWTRDDLRMSSSAAKTASLVQLSEPDRGFALINSPEIFRGNHGNWSRSHAKLSSWMCVRFTKSGSENRR